MRTIFLLLTVLGFSSMDGQFCDDFSNFDTIAWQGDDHLFGVNTEGELQLQSDMQREAGVFRLVNDWDSLIWSGHVRLDFSPSASNRLNIVLMADTPSYDAEEKITLQLGESGIDSLRLLHSTKGKTVEVGAMGNVALNKPSVNFHFRITRKPGHWKLQIDSLPIDDQTETNSITDTLTIVKLPYFGIHCQFTASRKDKFYFDDLCIGQVFKDQKGPVLNHLEVANETQVRLTFNEQLSPSQNIKTYLAFLPDIDIHGTVLDKKTLEITFAERLKNGQSYTLAIDSISDEVGNWTVGIMDSFKLLTTEVAKPYEILFHEIMADPEPSVGLPASEYFEIINASDRYFNLMDYTISDNRSTVFLPDTLLGPGDILLLCPNAMKENFPDVNRIGLTNFPSLNNDGDQMILQDFAGRIVHQVDYDASWYQDDDKADGGYSLEMIDVKNVCSGARNWKAAGTLDGGTPGLPNSGPNSNLPIQSIELLYAIAPTAHQIELVFNQYIQVNLSLDSFYFLIDPPIGITSIIQHPTKPSTAFLNLEVDLITGEAYTVEVSNQIPNCKGVMSNQSITKSVFFPALADSGDVIINEILFNPESGGPDFIELLNTTDKYLILENMYFGSFVVGDTEVVAIPDGIQLYPRETYAFTSKSITLLEYHPEAPEDKIVFCNLPSLDDGQGNATLYRSIFGRQDIYDALSYDAEWHHPLLRDQNGVSLERLCAECPTDNYNNWHSASQAQNYATPGRANSQGYELSMDAKAYLHLPYDEFSPDLDGHRDFLLIEIMPDRAGYLLRMNIFDMDGHQLATLADNDLLGGEAFYQWNGFDDLGNRLRTGPYFVYAEFLHPDGDVKKIKSAFNLF